MTFTLLPKREKEDVRFRDEQIGESHRAEEANASAVEHREGCSLSVCPKCSLSKRAPGSTRHPSHSHLKGVLLRMAC